MKRRLFRFLSVLLLVLCVATCVLWRGSYSVDRAVDYSAGSRWTGIYTREGMLYVSSRNGEEGTFHGLSYFEQQIAERDGMFFVDSHFRWQVLGFAADRQQPPGFDDGVMQWDMRMPFWMLVAILGVMPMLTGLRWFRRLRSPRLGLCPFCGYDLRATPERCPECGQASKNEDA